MGKLLPALGIVGAVTGALAVAVLVDVALFLVVPVAVAGAIALFLHRTIPGMVAGIVVLALGVLAAMGLAGSVTTEDGAADFGIGEGAGRVLAVASCLAVLAGVLVVRWEEAEPRWLAIAGAACAAIAFAMAASDPDAIGQQNRPGTLVAALFALLSLAPMVPLLRAPSALDDRAPPVVADAPPPGPKGRPRRP